MHQYYVYMMTNKPNGVLYIGVTNDLKRRCYEHQRDLLSGFSKKYNLHSLVYFESTSCISAAIAREKKLKHWKRDWKIALIEQFNPKWKDLSIGNFTDD